MITTVNSVSARAGAAYLGFLNQIVGIFTNTASGAAPTSPGARNAFSSALITAQNSLINALNTIIAEAQNSLIEDAIVNGSGSLEAPDKQLLVDLIDQARGDLVGMITSCAAKDIMTVERVLRIMALNVDALMSSREITYSKALMITRVGLHTEFRFSQPDSAGRRWSTPEYVKASISVFLTQTYTDTFVYCLIKQGETFGVVRHPDRPDLMFALIGEVNGYPTYDEIKGAVWHPNGRATIARFS